MLLLQDSITFILKKKIITLILFFINPSWGFLGTLGALAIPMGAGDYMNIFNAIRQMPKGARVYMHGMHSYWYMP